MLFEKVVKIIFGDKHKRDRKRLWPIVEEVNEIHAELKDLSDEDLKNKTSEFRRLLGVAPRVSRVDDQVIIHERAEDVLSTHPDIDRAVFVGTRRDAHPAELVAWVKLKEGVEPSEDLGGQIRGGMGRLGPGYSPAYIFFVDELPMKDDNRGRPQIDYHLVRLATEQNERSDWKVVKWADLEQGLERDQQKYKLEDLMPEASVKI